MNNIIEMSYNGSEIRSIDIDGQIWWVLKDVCKILDLSTPAKVSKRLDEDEVNQIHTTDSLGRNQNVTIINESGLYSVILRSDKPEAKPFRRWITHEVLPEIRRTGTIIFLKGNLNARHGMAFRFLLYQISPSVWEYAEIQQEKGFSDVCVTVLTFSFFPDIRYSFLSLKTEMFL